jgi:hypothetical protein
MAVQLMALARRLCSYGGMDPEVLVQEALIRALAYHGALVAQQESVCWACARLFNPRLREADALHATGLRYRAMARRMGGRGHGGQLALPGAPGTEGAVAAADGW